MSDSLECVIDGGAAIEKMLNGLAAAPKREFKKIMRKELTDNLKPMQAEAKSRAPKLTGRLRRAIKIKSVKGAPGDIIRVMEINRGKKRNDKRGAYYGWMIEFGYIAGGKYKPGKRFMTIAYLRNKNRALRKSVEALTESIDKVIKWYS